MRGLKEGKKDRGEEALLVLPSPKIKFFEGRGQGASGGGVCNIAEESIPGALLAVMMADYSAARTAR